MPRVMSDLEATLLFQIRATGLPEPELEVKFHPERRWRFDFAWPDRRLAVEVEGGVHRQGRHTRGRGFENDCFKYNAATVMGWKVLRYTAGMVDTGAALRQIAEVLEGMK